MSDAAPARARARLPGVMIRWIRAGVRRTTPVGRVRERADVSKGMCPLFKSGSL